MTNTLSISLAQLNLTVGDVPGNTAAIVAAIDAAKSEQSANLVVFQELALCGYPPEDLLFHSGTGSAYIPPHPVPHRRAGYTWRSAIIEERHEALHAAHARGRTLLENVLEVGWWEGTITALVGWWAADPKVYFGQIASLRYEECYLTCYSQGRV